MLIYWLLHCNALNICFTWQATLSLTRIRQTDTTHLHVPPHSGPMPRLWCACNSCPQKSIITTRQQLHNSQWIFCQKPTLPQPQTGTTTKTNPGAQKTKLAGRFTCNLRFVFRRHCYGALLLWSPGLGQILVCLVMCLFVGLGGDCDAAGRRGGGTDTLRCALARRGLGEFDVVLFTRNVAYGGEIDNCFATVLSF